jgi:hypothetical protein
MARKWQRTLTSAHVHVVRKRSCGYAARLRGGQQTLQHRLGSRQSRQQPRRLGHCRRTVWAARKATRRQRRRRRRRPRLPGSRCLFGERAPHLRRRVVTSSRGVQRGRGSRLPRQLSSDDKRGGNNSGTNADGGDGGDIVKGTQRRRETKGDSGSMSPSRLQDPFSGRLTWSVLLAVLAGSRPCR